MAAVDTSIYPHATGAAAGLAASHTAPCPLKLYGAWFCPFVQRAWIVLHEKCISHQYVEINPYHKEASFLAVNPRGLVPALGVPVPAAEVGATDGDLAQLKPLYESTVICEYLDEAYSDEAAHGPPLLPRGDGSAGAYERGRCHLWIDHIATRIVPAFYRFLQHTPDKPFGLGETREEFLRHIKTLVREMDASGPWFLGERFGMVDVALAPWAMRLFLIDHYKTGGVGVPQKGEGGDDEEVWERWRSWVEAVAARPSVRDTWSDEKRYLEVYKRYADDTTQSEVGKATRAGKVLP